MFVWNTKIMYSQLGRNCALSLPALLDLFQDIATLHAHEMGSGLEYLYSIDRAWIMSRWRVRLGNLPRCGDDVTVRTRAYECRRALNRRAFALVDGDGQVLAQADSLWTLIDTKTGGPVNAADIVQPYLTPGEGPELGDLPRKVQLPEDAVAGQPFAITADLLDTNHHVNNGQYVRIALDSLNKDCRIRQLRAEYKKQSYLNDVLTPYVSASEDGIYVVVLKDEQDATVCVVEIQEN